MGKKKVLIATTNAGKIAATKLVLGKLGWEALSFADLGLDLAEPEETKLTAEEIALEKAVRYAEQYRDLPVLARDDTVRLLGVDEEDDPKNHNKEFVARRAGEYSDENGEKVFAEVARKYGREVDFVFDWGYGLAWWEGGKIKAVSGLARTDGKLVDVPCGKMIEGFCFSAICKVEVDGVWRYDSELSEAENWRAYWDKQGEVMGRLLAEYEGSEVAGIDDKTNLEEIK